MQKSRSCHSSKRRNNSSLIPIALKIKCSKRKYGCGVPTASTYFWYRFGNHYAYLEHCLTIPKEHTSFTSACCQHATELHAFAEIMQEYQASLYMIDGVVHMSVSPLTLVNHLSKGAFNRPLTHNTDTIHLRSHTHSKILLCFAQACCHMLLKFTFGKYRNKNIVRTKSLG